MKKLFIGLLSIFFLFSCGNNEKGNNKINNSEKIILALGDSITAGYGVKKSKSYPSQLEKLLIDNNYNYKVINAGVSGDTSKNLLNRIIKYNEIKADIYIITIGGNDALKRKSISNMVINIESIIDYLQNINPEAKIILSGIKIPIQLGFKYSRDFNKVFKKISKNKKIFFLENFLENISGYTQLNLSDNIHPNIDGYKKISKNIYNFLEKNNIISK